MSELMGKHFESIRVHFTLWRCWVHVSYTVSNMLNSRVAWSGTWNIAELMWKHFKSIRVHFTLRRCWEHVNYTVTCWIRGWSHISCVIYYRSYIVHLISRHFVSYHDHHRCHILSYRIMFDQHISDCTPLLSHSTHHSMAYRIMSVNIIPHHTPSCQSISYHNHAVAIWHHAMSHWNGLKWREWNYIICCDENDMASSLWNDMIDMIRHDMIWFDMIWYDLTSLRLW